jgi:predicted transposase YbfD/YdcC
MIDRISIHDHFRAIRDPRVERTKLHSLHDIITIAICAIICNADGWEDIAEFGVAKQEWFRQFLALPNGIPSHDTFGRVFAQLDPEQFQASFRRWIQTVAQQTNGQIIPIDGKTLRHSYTPGDPKSAIHMVSAWAASNRLVLAQVKTDEKSNEITAIPALLNLLALSGCIVTIDAMGCQKAIVSTIRAKDADYVIAVKANQPHLFEDIQRIFQEILHEEAGASDTSYMMRQSVDHGRDVIRQVWTTPRTETIRNKDAWEDLQIIGMVMTECVTATKSSIDVRYYIASIDNNAKRLDCAVRTHWEIENCVHWTLDVTFNEDASTIHKDHAPENMAVLRHVALNLLQQETTLKRSIRGKRLRAGWDDAYLEKVIAYAPNILISPASEVN